MNTLYVNEKSLCKFKKLKTDFSNESKLYLKNDLLYKILLINHRNDERYNNIKQLSEYNHPNCIFPKDIIFNEETNEFIGLTIEYLKKYKTLSKSLNKDHLDLNKRKEIANKICDTQYFLEKEGISFLDMHSNNVMIKDDDVKVIDLDSSTFYRQKYSPVFEHLRRDIISSNLSQLCFKLLYGKDLNLREIDKSSINKLISMCNEKQRILLEKVFLNRSTLINPQNYLDDFDENFMEESKLVLHK